MLQKLKERFTISILNTLLTKYDTATSSYQTEELEAGKRLISVIAGIYIFQKGIRNIRKHPVLAVEEVALGSILLYSAAAGLNKKIIKKPVDIADIRRNQIQGNDPNSFAPAFV
ncbi:hypothetical protein [Pedobacter nyackensis]|uniref:hypothetical protein n=1 Tax=Pedobacter nyackensis TaxID=475255 RepID=UPI0029314E1B|nr:hypothetical protein [Pedobacter nyackensis]